jgi:REP element-mobilizing transposase RayT
MTENRSLPPTQILKLPSARSKLKTDSPKVRKSHRQSGNRAQQPKKCASAGHTLCDVPPTMQPTFHFLASCNPGQSPLLNRELQIRLWRQLQLRFPKVWACLFMPDHIHLVAATKHPADFRRQLAIEARAACRSLLPGKRVWAPSPEPEDIPNSLHLKRTIRYVHLNPCRDRLAPDPIQWEMSTHRDVLGLTAKSWIDLDPLAELFRCSRAKLPEIFHSYVSSDPTVAVAGTPLPKRVDLSTPTSASPLLCAQAIAAVSRATPTEVLRKGELRDIALYLATESARNPRSEVQRAFDIGERTLHRVLSRPADAKMIAAAQLYLRDPRCYEWAPSLKTQTHFLKN